MYHCSSSWSRLAWLDVNIIHGGNSPFHYFSGYWVCHYMLSKRGKESSNKLHTIVRFHSMLSLLLCVCDNNVHSWERANGCRNDYWHDSWFNCICLHYETWLHRLRQSLLLPHYGCIYADDCFNVYEFRSMVASIYLSCSCCGLRALSYLWHIVDCRRWAVRIKSWWLYTGSSAYLCRHHDALLRVTQTVWLIQLMIKGKSSSHANSL